MRRELAMPYSRRAALGGFGAASAVLLGTGATGGTASASLRQPAPGYGADVRKFGAKGDGRTDDTAGFEAAFSAASGDGCHLVVVPAGRYRITHPLSAVAPIRIIGLSGEAGSIIAFDPGLASGLTVTQASTEEPYPGPAIELAGLWLDYDGPGAAVAISEQGVRAPFHDTRITGCRFQLRGGATGFSSTNQRSIIVTQNQFLGAGTSSGTGIAVNDSDNTMIAHNVFYELAYGIHGIRGTARVYNAGCMIAGNSMSGFQKALFFENWESIQAAGNMLDGASVSCVHLADCYNSALSDNYCGLTGTGSALLIETAQQRGGLGQIIFSSNFINHYAGASGDAAIALTGGSSSIPVDQVLITSNIINLYPSVGIHLRNSQNILINGNTLTKAGSLPAGTRAVYDETPGANIIVGNITDAQIDADGDTVRDNYARAPLPG
jgi:hypothetical protein